MKLFKKKPKTVRATEQLDENFNSPLASNAEVIEEMSGRDTVAGIANTLGGGVKFVIGIALFTVFVLVSIYTVLSATLMFTAPSDDSAMERLWVARGTFQGGQIDSNVNVYGSATQEAPTDFVGRMIEGFVGTPDHFVIKTIAGPVAEVGSSKGVITVNGVKTPYKGKVANTKLIDQYLGQCIEGSCKPGEYVVVNYSSVSGEVRGVLGLTGLKDINE